MNKNNLIVSDQKIRHLLARLWVHLRIRRRIQFGLVLILMVLASFAEVVSIGAIVPFLAVLTNPQQVFEHQGAQPVLNFLHIQSQDELLLVLTLFFVISALLSGMIRILLAWASTRVTFGTGADFSVDIYRRTLYQPYSVHVARNSSEIINGILTKTNSVIYSTISPSLALISSVIMLSAILGTLIYLEPLISLATFSGFGCIYLLIIRLTRARKIKNSYKISRESTQVVKSLQEGLGGIRDVLIDGSQAAYCKIYQESDYPLRRAQGNNLFIGLAPRYGIEALGMVLIAGVSYMLSKQSDGLTNAIPILGMLALGAQRLLPVMQQAYQSWSSIVGGQSSLEDTLNLLDQPLPQYSKKLTIEALPFDKKIVLKNLSFRYSPDTPWVLKNISFDIERGSRVGFIGATGSGKSTLLDIVMGLLEPSEGSLEVDERVINSQNNRAWQARIAHVPQAIFLADSSIEENIAFGIPLEKINYERVLLAAQQAQIAETIRSWPAGYKTLVGERGVRLSGGQRQRIGIARALYKNADVIILDEATSALDNDTEQSVMQAIESLNPDITILIIAHRLTTLKDCNQIVELNDGEINRVGTYDEIISNASIKH